MTVTDLYQIRTVAEELYVGFAISTQGAAACGASTALVFALMLTGLGMATFDRLVVAATHVPTRSPFRFALGGWKWLVAAGVAMVLVMLVGVPLGNLIYQAGIVVDHVRDQPQRYWSLQRLAELLIPWPGTYRLSAVGQFSRQFRWSLLIATAAATLSLVVAMVVGWSAPRGSWRAIPAALCAAPGSRRWDH